ncbi:hypothetical protein LLG46_13070 [bacterium]|nr:hypothetical protein [bacterium]
MPSRLKITVVCFNISAVLSIVCGIIMFIFGIRSDPTFIIHCSGQPGVQLHHTFPLFGAFHVAAIVGGLLLIFVAAPLIRHIALALTGLRYWAWLTGLILSGLMIFNGWHAPYVFTVLGGLSLWGLLDKETLEAFLHRPTNDRQPTTEN